MISKSFGRQQTVHYFLMKYESFFLCHYFPKEKYLYAFANKKIAQCLAKANYDRKLRDKRTQNSKEKAEKSLTTDVLPEEKPKYRYAETTLKIERYVVSLSLILKRVHSNILPRTLG